MFVQAQRRAGRGVSSTSSTSCGRARATSPAARRRRARAPRTSRSPTSPTTPASRRCSPRRTSRRAAATAPPGAPTRQQPRDGRACGSRRSSTRRRRSTSRRRTCGCGPIVEALLAKKQANAGDRHQDLPRPAGVHLDLGRRTRRSRTRDVPRRRDDRRPEARLPVQRLPVLQDARRCRHRRPLQELRVPLGLQLRDADALEVHGRRRQGADHRQLQPLDELRAGDVRERDPHHGAPTYAPLVAAVRARTSRRSGTPAAPRTCSPALRTKIDERRGDPDRVRRRWR